MVLTNVLLAVVSLMPVCAQERMNVVQTDKSVKSFDIPKVEQVTFDNKGTVLVQVGNAEGITASAATISARLAAEDSDMCGITCGFFYGTTPSPRLQVQAGVVLKTDDVTMFTANLSGLQPNTTYYFRPYAELNGMYYYGNTSFFRTDEEQTNTEGVAFLSQYASPDEIVQKGDDDEASAWLWFHQEYPQCPFLYAGDIQQCLDTTCQHPAGHAVHTGLVSGWRQPGALAACRHLHNGPGTHGPQHDAQL